MPRIDTSPCLLQGAVPVLPPLAMAPPPPHHHQQAGRRFLAGGHNHHHQLGHQHAGAPARLQQDHQPMIWRSASMDSVMMAGRPSNPAATMSRADMKKSSFYVWFLGAMESDGLWGEECINPAAESLIANSGGKDGLSHQQAAKVTLQISNKGLKIIQVLPRRSQPDRMETIKQFVPHDAVTCVVQQPAPDDDVVACILMIRNPVTGYPAHVHVYRCDSAETASFLKEQLEGFVKGSDHLDRLMELEARLDLRTCRTKRDSSSPNSSSSPTNRHSRVNQTSKPIGNNNHTSSQNSAELDAGKRRSRSSDSSSGSGSAESCAVRDKISSLYDSLAAELREKLAAGASLLTPVHGSKNEQSNGNNGGLKKGVPLLLPPRDYDTMHRSFGKLEGIDERRSRNLQVVGINGTTTTPHPHQHDKLTRAGNTGNTAISSDNDKNRVNISGTGKSAGFADRGGAWWKTSSGNVGGGAGGGAGGRNNDRKTAAPGDLCNNINNNPDGKITTSASRNNNGRPHQPHRGGAAPGQQAQPVGRSSATTAAAMAVATDQDSSGIGSDEAESSPVATPQHGFYYHQQQQQPQQPPLGRQNNRHLQQQQQQSGNDVNNNNGGRGDGPRRRQLDAGGGRTNVRRSSSARQLQQPVSSSGDGGAGENEDVRSYSASSDEEWERNRVGRIDDPSMIFGQPAVSAGFWENEERGKNRRPALPSAWSSNRNGDAGNNKTTRTETSAIDKNAATCSSPSPTNNNNNNRHQQAATSSSSPSARNGGKTTNGNGNKTSVSPTRQLSERFVRSASGPADVVVGGGGNDEAGDGDGDDDDDGDDGQQQQQPASRNFHDIRERFRNMEKRQKTTTSSPPLSKNHNSNAVSASASSSASDSKSRPAAAAAAPTSKNKKVTEGQRNFNQLGAPRGDSRDYSGESKVEDVGVEDLDPDSDAGIKARPSPHSSAVQQPHLFRSRSQESPDRSRKRLLARKLELEAAMQRSNPANNGPSARQWNANDPGIKRWSYSPADFVPIANNGNVNRYSQQEPGDWNKEPWNSGKRQMLPGHPDVDERVTSSPTATAKKSSSREHQQQIEEHLYEQLPADTGAANRSASKTRARSRSRGPVSRGAPSATDRNFPATSDVLKRRSAPIALEEFRHLEEARRQQHQQQPPPPRRTVRRDDEAENDEADEYYAAVDGGGGGGGGFRYVELSHNQRFPGLDRDSARMVHHAAGFGVIPQPHHHHHPEKDYRNPRFAKQQQQAAYARSKSFVEPYVRHP